ncbi:MAG: hypothetical protein M3Q00_04830 [Pseudomonadota bacterium]|nr:hypothetical protein [Pseudomonadota bacterium]
MLTTKSLSVVIATVAALSANVFAAPRQDNPVHPAYYAERAIVAFEYLPTQPYGDAGNPLHPAFAKTTFNDAWLSTGAIDAKPYVESRNPLHPAFKHF